MKCANHLPIPVRDNELVIRVLLDLLESGIICLVQGIFIALALTA